MIISGTIPIFVTTHYNFGNNNFVGLYTAVQCCCGEMGECGLTGKDSDVAKV